MGNFKIAGKSSMGMLWKPKIALQTMNHHRQVIVFCLLCLIVAIWQYWRSLVVVMVKGSLWIQRLRMSTYPNVRGMGLGVLIRWLPSKEGFKRLVDYLPSYEVDSIADASGDGSGSMATRGSGDENAPIDSGSSNSDCTPTQFSVSAFSCHSFAGSAQVLHSPSPGKMECQG